MERQLAEPKDAIAGKDLKLSIDLDLQAVAELSMEDKRGSVVALDPRNGEVLAMVSRPTYDPNKFTGRISRDDWSEITGDPYHPLMNRAVQAQLAPGSTFKPIMALAGPRERRSGRRYSISLPRRSVVLWALFRVPPEAWTR